LNAKKKFDIHVKIGLTGASLAVDVMLWEMAPTAKKIVIGMIVPAK
jgi:hypothetical protein